MEINVALWGGADRANSSDDFVDKSEYYEIFSAVTKVKVKVNGV